ncbi:unnamed protein product [Polarella glacialis]|uniref:Sushi domain-containing protein n=1 Tax=Polarella glacialis TaxID=89957 RepID=A0A813LI40_POLGL|nr:unnamed protein product [Polarella glacialis]
MNGHEVIDFEPLDARKALGNLLGPGKMAKLLPRLDIVLLLPLLLHLPCAWAVASVNQVHWLLRMSEELHRTFNTTERGVQVLRVTTVDGQLCAKSMVSSVVSRKLYEDSWTGAYTHDGGFLESVYNGTCFARCEAAGQEYPKVQDSSGVFQFRPEDGALEALRWAAAQAKAEAWQREQAELLVQLSQATDDSSALAISLKVKPRLVTPATAPAPAPGSQALPTTLQPVRQDFADAKTVWQAGINASALLETGAFDFTRRAVRALAVGASLALQAGAVAAMAELNCESALLLRSAAIADLGQIQTAVGGLLQDLENVLTEPLNSQAADGPLRRCLRQRVASAKGVAATTPPSAPGFAVDSLLSLDFCGRLFDATSKQIVAISPYTAAAPPSSPTALFSALGEERQVHVDSASGLVYVSPYANFADRGLDNPDFFTASDKVIVLQGVAELSVRGGGTLPAYNRCTTTQKNDLQRSVTWPDCNGGNSDCSSSPCSVEGCVRTSCMCDPVAAGYYTTDGITREACDPGGANLQGNGYFYAAGNNSCPFVCQPADKFQWGSSCLDAINGFYSTTCSNAVTSCDLPLNVPARQFKSVVRFTSPGRGSPTGCAANLTFPVAMPSSAASAPLEPPFTVELFVNILAAELPADGRASVLMGTFPRWYIGLQHFSASSAKLCFYHSRITLALKSREASLLCSDPVPWGPGWRHVAVVVSSSSSSSATVNFFVDGSLASNPVTLLLSTASVPAPHVHPDQSDVFHLGPPNMKLFQELLATDRTEPYFQSPQFSAQLDEARVSRAALDGLTLGARLTELRRRAACDPFERLEASTCRSTIRLTPTKALADQSGYVSQCQPGYEPCAALPGHCVAVCARGTLRQGDCTCDCPPGKFQVWFISAVLLKGSGSILNATVYDAAHRVVGFADAGLLPKRINLQSGTTDVSVVAVRGGGTASMVSLWVETPTEQTPSGETLAVPALQNVRLEQDRNTLLHHRRTHDLFDPSLSCAACTGEVLGSRLPRVDALSCYCAPGYGRNLFGRCVPLRGALPPPVSNIPDGYHTAGTRIRLTAPLLQAIEGPWLVEIRYTQGADPQAPTCQDGMRYQELNDGLQPGLDLIRARETVKVCSVLCHPMHYSSDVACFQFEGNNQMNPPTCSEFGAKSNATAFALQVQVSLYVDLQPQATIYYDLGSGTATYSMPLVVTSPGITVVRVWAQQPGFDQSAITTCSFIVDGPPRASVDVLWPALEEGASPQLGGFVYEEQAYLARRNLDVLRFTLEATAPVSGPALGMVQLEYRLKRGSQAMGEWLAAPSGGALALTVAEQLQAPNTSTLLRVEWRAKESGYVWTEPGAMQVLLLATRAIRPTLEAAPWTPWALGDSWLPDPRRDIALRQVHRVELRPPSSAARLLFSVTQAVGSFGSLLKTSSANATSLRSGGLLERFAATAPLAGLAPDDMPSKCGGTLAFQAGSSEQVPKLCDYLVPFQVLAGMTISVFALEPGKLESEVLTFVVPRELEPPAGDSTFDVGVFASGGVLTVSEAERLQVLASSAAGQALTFSLGQDGTERQSCMLVTHFSYSSSSGGNSSSQAERKTLSDCTWLPYNGPRQRTWEELDAAPVVFEATGASNNLNITVFSTLRKPGYLWSQPRAHTFLFLRARTPAPRVVGILEPDVSAGVAAMVWLQAEALGSGNSDSFPRCFFTLNSQSFEESDLPPYFLAAVPSTAATIPSVRQALQPTEHMRDAVTVASWASDLTLCASAVCELPMNGTLPAELIHAPANLPKLCAWAVWPGYRESLPICKLMGSQAQSQMIAPTFTPTLDAAGLQQLLAAGLTENPVIVSGFDRLLGATVVQFRNLKAGATSGRSEEAPIARRLAPAAMGLPIFLDRTSPLQYRHSAVPVDPWQLLHANASQEMFLQAAGALSAWQNLGVADPTPLVPIPSRRLSEHVLFRVDVRLTTGVNRWSRELQSFALAILGEQPSVEVQRQGSATSRTLAVRSPRANSTIFYRWLSGSAPTPPLATDGGPIVRLQAGFDSLADAFKLEAGIARQVQAQGNASVSTELCVAPEAGSAAAQEEKWLGPRLCTWHGDAWLETSAPDSRHWTLWAASSSPGLPLSAPTAVVVEQQCAAPQGIKQAFSVACSQGQLIDGGDVCTPQCKQGFKPSVEEALSCKNGSLSPASFTCEEMACQLPFNLTSGALQPCKEAAQLLASGSTCTTQCAAGFAPSEQRLICVKGLLDPPSFTCEELPCDSPGDVLHAASPSCSGLQSVKSGGECVPQCQDGYAASSSALTCTRGVLSPASFSCAPGVPLDIAPLIAGVPSGLVAGFLALATAYCCFKRPGAKTVTGPPVEPTEDSLQEWWKCVHEVEPGMCVFCGKNPEEVEASEDEHGASTFFRCCNDCAAVLLIEQEQEESLSTTAGSAAASEQGAPLSPRSQSSHEQPAQHYSTPAKHGSKEAGDAKGPPSRADTYTLFHEDTDSSYHSSISQKGRLPGAPAEARDYEARGASLQGSNASSLRVATVDLEFSDEAAVRVEDSGSRFPPSDGGESYGSYGSRRLGSQSLGGFSRAASVKDDGFDHSHRSMIVTPQNSQSRGGSSNSNNQREEGNLDTSRSLMSKPHGSLKSSLSKPQRSQSRGASSRADEEKSEASHRSISNTRDSVYPKNNKNNNNNNDKNKQQASGSQGRSMSRSNSDSSYSPEPVRHGSGSRPLAATLKSPARAPSQSDWREESSERRHTWSAKPDPTSFSSSEDEFPPQKGTSNNLTSNRKAFAQGRSR